MFLSGPIAIPPEPLRPQFHFTAPSGWLNDPNGLVYERGRYHLFYQHNPFGTLWGNMTWGHATSRDLLQWEHLPHAIEPDALGTIFSGSAVIDRGNVSGFGSKGKPAMLCFYTAAGGTNDLSKGKPFSQCLAYSTDGVHFTKYSGNPIIPHIEAENRDPKVVWHERSRQWVMALYLVANRYRFFGSKNLKEWIPLSEYKMPGTDECPDLFELAYKGGKRWVFWGANGNYQVGDFDGSKFVPETPVLRAQFGNTGYASQTYSNAPRGRCIQIAWMNGADFPNCAWNQQMALPNTLSLHETKDGPRLAYSPVEEIKKIRGVALRGSGGAYSISSGLVDFEAVWKNARSGIGKITVNGMEITLDMNTKKISALDKTADIPEASTLSLRIIADRTTVEIYAQKGLLWMPMFRLPKPNQRNGVDVATPSEWRGNVKVFELSP
jgi:fructan beta-fructosidase